jgi:hypothetical protein
MFSLYGWVISQLIPQIMSIFVVFYLKFIQHSIFSIISITFSITLDLPAHKIQQSISPSEIPHVCVIVLMDFSVSDQFLKCNDIINHLACIGYDLIKLI